MKKRRITVVTGTRAEYGLLKPVIQAIQKHSDLKLQIIATGMHLLKTFGYTVKEIESDGLPIDAKVKLQTEDDNILNHAVGLGKAISKMSKAYAELKSDIVLLLGDRIEIFAAASAATASQIPIAHIHGGDVATGIQDDAYRHAISKLAHIHFPASAQSKSRLIKLGEDPFRIYQTGSPAIDELSGIPCKKKSILDECTGLNTQDPFMIILQHPAGFAATKEETWMKQTLKACESKGLPLIILYPNSDPGHSGIIRAIQQYNFKVDHCILKHLPRPIFLGLLRKTFALVGNSSCGIIESSYLNADVLNVGPRQTGRERDTNVIDSKYGFQHIKKGLDQISQRKAVGHLKCNRIYGSGKAGQKIAKALAKIRVDKTLLRKKIVY